MKSIWGFGGVRITDGVNDVTFDYAKGDIEFSPIYEEIINDDDDIITRLRGYRPYIKLKWLNNYGATGYTSYQTLFSILTLLVDPTTQNTVTIYPRYNSSYNNLSYTCVLDSNVAPQDLAGCETGQSLSLNFKCINKVYNIPTLVHVAAAAITDEGDAAITDEGDANITDA